MTGAAAGARGCGSRPIEVRRIDWWATAVQLLGTLFFNVPETAYASSAASMS
jgi:hypothetical protein